MDTAAYLNLAGTVRLDNGYNCFTNYFTFELWIWCSIMQHCDCEARNRDSVENDACYIWRGYPTDDDSNVLSSDLHELHSSQRLTTCYQCSIVQFFFLCDLSSKERAANAMHACPADCSDIHEPNVNHIPQVQLTTIIVTPGDPNAHGPRAAQRALTDFWLCPRPTAHRRNLEICYY